MRSKKIKRIYVFLLVVLAGCFLWINYFASDEKSNSEEGKRGVAYFMSDFVNEELKFPGWRTEEVKIISLFGLWLMDNFNLPMRIRYCSLDSTFEYWYCIKHLSGAQLKEINFAFKNFSFHDRIKKRAYLEWRSL